MVGQSVENKPVLNFNLVLLTMDTHLNSAAKRAQARLQKNIPGFHLSVHSASEYSASDKSLVACKKDIATADLIVVTMLFLEDHYLPILEDLKQRRENCDAIVCAMSAGEVVKLTRMGKLDMSKPASGPMAFLKKLRGKAGKDKTATAGAKQMKMLNFIPKMLKFIPGTAQDVRAYFLALQYWLGGSEDNLFNMMNYLMHRYADDSKAFVKKNIKVIEPVQYPDLGVYHPRMKNRFSSDLDALPTVIPDKRARGKVGLLLLRSYLISGNSGHYDPVIVALEAQGFQVIPAFAAGLDSRPAIDAFFMKNGKVTIDALVSLTGFSLVGGPAYNDAKAAEEILTKLNVPYIAAHPVEFHGAGRAA